MTRPLIMLANDDGIRSSGIRALGAAARRSRRPHRRRARSRALGHQPRLHARSPAALRGGRAAAGSWSTARPPTASTSASSRSARASPTSWSAASTTASTSAPTSSTRAPSPAPSRRRCATCRPSPCRSSGSAACTRPRSRSSTPPSSRTRSPAPCSPRGCRRARCSTSTCRREAAPRGYRWTRLGKRALSRPGRRARRSARPPLLLDRRPGRRATATCPARTATRCATASSSVTPLDLDLTHAGLLERLPEWNVDGFDRVLEQDLEKSA